MNPTSCDCILCLLCEGSTDLQSRFHRHYPLQRCFLCLWKWPSSNKRMGCSVVGFTHYTNGSIHPTKLSVWIHPLELRDTAVPSAAPSSSPLFILCEIKAKEIICYPNDKQNTAVVTWHFSAEVRPPTCRFARKDLTLRLGHCRHTSVINNVKLGQNLPFIYLTQCNKNCETWTLLHPISRSVSVLSGFLKNLSEWLSRKLLSPLQPDVFSLMQWWRWALVLCEIMSDVSCVVCCEVEKPGVRNEHAFSQFFSIRCEDTSICHTLENKTSLKWAFCNT